MPLELHPCELFSRIWWYCNIIKIFTLHMILVRIILGSQLSFKPFTYINDLDWNPVQASLSFYNFVLLATQSLPFQPWTFNSFIFPSIAFKIQILVVGLTKISFDLRYEENFLFPASLLNCCLLNKTFSLVLNGFHI